MAPSSLRGDHDRHVGNCGVGFTPSGADRHAWLISLLRGVEDILGTAWPRLTWDRESFPDSVAAAKPHTVDIGAHVPHAALRTYVMGERGAEHTEVPDRGRDRRMAAPVEEALAAEPWDSPRRAPRCTAPARAPTSAP